MKLVKRLDIFMLSNFLTLFAGTFCISLFVVMMQFLWKFIDDLIGKGLTWDVYAEIFFYAAEGLVPLALPLAVLLASLISFGNIGERLELLAIKAAGISLFRTLRPLICLNVILALASFHFQNKVVPEAQQKLRQRMYALKVKSPELDIPEGAFYNGIPSINMYVERKNKDTGMLYDVMIYNFQDGVGRAHIIVADSGRIESTRDKMHMLLHLYQGGQFENVGGGDGLQLRDVPYRRETFVEKHFIIDFDTNFNIADESEVSDRADTKDMAQLVHDIDSMTAVGDSLGLKYAKDMKRNTLAIPHKMRTSDYDSIALAGMSETTLGELEEAEKSYRRQQAKWGAKTPTSTVDIDSLMAKMDMQQKQKVMMNAVQKAAFEEMDLSMNSVSMEYSDKIIRVHQIQFWEKITMSLAILIFFFIGSSLGAITRKGGLGFPVVVAVIIFIVYYTISTFGKKVGREGNMPVEFGMWLSTLIMAPLGVFFTVKSNNDSTVFNMDGHIALWKKLIGIRPKRNIMRKEVIINDPDYPNMVHTLEELINATRTYLASLPRATLFGYARYITRHWLSKREDIQAENVCTTLESVVEELSNSKDRLVLRLLCGYPVVDTRSVRFYRRRRKDMREIIKYSEKIKQHIYDNILSVQ